jgi:hypothetical protein
MQVLTERRDRERYAQHDPEDLDTNGPDHTVDACKYLLVATHDKRYTFQPGATDFRVW